MAELTEIHPHIEAVSQEIKETPIHVFIWRRVQRYAPGILLLVAVGYFALVCSYFLTGLSYIPMSILVGAFISNSFGLHPVLEKGISTYELWLKVGIVLLGAQVAFTQLGIYWLKVLPSAMLIVLLGFFITLVIGKWFRLPRSLAILIAAGSGICGVSAIINTSKRIDASEEETEYAIGTVLVFGALAIVLYPILGRLLGLSEHIYGTWTGLSVNNTAEVVATGYTLGAAAGAIAIATKLCRILTLGAVISIIDRIDSRESPPGDITIRNIWKHTPKFILAFVVLSIVSSLGFLSTEDKTSLYNLSSWFFLMAFAGIGFRLRWSDLSKVGYKPLLAGGISTLFIASTSLIISMIIS